ncbi:MAG: type IV pilus assembly protein PilX [Candidatus Magnetoglobus multicellularis str. Araruama]|uniref:Type IV pilus assembly protein PilX n=1 Tax=Candidatus Magnetoglobus multicellularis str. Araruama TaxID=890399 RepID=A0A1V1PBA7_9BACT|nr:MAG: type IV pilus assembly protein PilX [Candidatus Magnetoglobus multicellularis str. Araruama]
MQESGNITVLVLMILAIMTLMAIASFQESTTEVYIAKNELSKNNSFYCAEAAIIEVSNALENASIEDLQEVMSTETSTYDNRNLDWIHADTQNPDLEDEDNWKAVSDILISMPQCENTRYLAIQNIYTDGDVLRNESLDMNKTGDSVQEYRLIARSNDCGSEATVEIGYRRRF